MVKETYIQCRTAGCTNTFSANSFPSKPRNIDCPSCGGKLISDIGYAYIANTDKPSYLKLNLESNITFDNKSAELIKLDMFLEKINNNDLSDKNGMVHEIVLNDKIIANQPMTTTDFIFENIVIHLNNLKSDNIYIAWHKKKESH